jgi:ATP-binding cassette, subfamily B, bacterial
MPRPAEPPFKRWGMDVIRLRIEVLRLLRIAERRLVIVLVVAAVAAGVLPLVFTILVGSLVGLIPDVVRDGFESEAGRRLAWILAASAVAIVARQIVDPVQEAVERIARRQIDELRAKTLDDLSRPHGVAHLEDPELLDHLELIKEGGLDLGASPGGAAVTTVRMLGFYVTGIGGAVIMGVAFSWLAAAGLLAACLVARRIIRRSRLAYLSVWGEPEQMRLQRRADYDQKLAIGPLGAKESRVFGLSDWTIDRFRVDWRDVMRKPAQIQMQLFRNFAIAFGTVLVAYAAVFLLVASAAIDGAIELGALALVIQASFDVAEVARGGAWEYELELGTVVLPRVTELGNLADRSARHGGRRTPSGAIPQREVNFDGVAFRYPGRDHDVVHRLDLSIPAGQSLAIVGPNGVGKTTIVKLLAGLYEPTKGRIIVDGTDLREIDMTTWQRRIAVIFQDYVRYELPARENVGFGSVAHLHDQAALVGAAAKSGALGVIDALPQGWRTVLSRQYTGGADLSGGEWQRIALARCHLAIEAGARILVLDEPTATLDVRAEAEFFERFVELTHGLTTILISHRFSTVRAASRIVVAGGGRIHEDGSHEELLALGGTYAEMFRLQAGRYAAHDEANERP